ncbi:HAMP domain-containing protein [Halioglobus maricola]|uniref:histidine kinase n=1 Tax=Halioglobus maricola TaxID=2601894 RepID=A0A5P9NNR8_9GAMM|nr:histidine kinase dimerization/phospho-acceptor domain-containing protein [Halioglobus maricola]QFU77480.1 HAMP domain-containing protein [Halioglobus maricola]
MKLSLRERLVWTLLAFTLFAWTASAGLTYFYANRVLHAQVDRQLVQYASLVSYVTGVFARQLDEGQPLYESWSGHEYDRAHLEPIVIDQPLAAELSPAVNVWEGENLIAVTDGSPHFERPTATGLVSLDRDAGATHWRILTLYNARDGLWIRVGIELGAARGAMLDTVGRSLQPLIIVLPLTILVLFFGVTRGLRPLNELARQIARRKPGLLDPVDTESVPDEVVDVVDSLNDLLHRLAVALEGEQRFTANASHELLTPLAAIKTEVQLCQRQLQTEEGARMLGRIASRVDRANHSVQQLLTLARLDPDQPLAITTVNLRALLAHVMAENGHLAADRELQVELEDGPEVQVEGSEEALAILLRNLVINAFRYATEGSVVSVMVERPGTIRIFNECAPLSSEEMERITERFYRVPGTASVGSGLGLSIVSRIVELHGAELRVGPGPARSGFQVEIVFSA